MQYRIVKFEEERPTIKKGSQPLDLSKGILLKWIPKK
jgi:hypothetical protein